MDFQTEYPRHAARSAELFRAASEIIPGGAGSSARTVKFGWKPYPLFIAEGSGSHITDVDGHEYIDYLLGLGPDILGHRHPVVTQAVADAIERYGTSFGLPYELEIEAARKVVDAVPSLEMVRFTNSGSEAVGTAVRLARAYTGRRILVRFEGHYHGWQDVVYWSNHVDPAAAGPADRPRPVAAGPGVPLELADTLEVLTWNDPESFQRLMDERGDEIAAVITEPAVFNTGCHPAGAGLPRAAARRDQQARRAAHLRRGHHRLPLLPRRRPGVVRRHAGPDDAGQGPRRRLPRGRRRRHARGHGHDRRGPLLALRHLQRQRRPVRRRLGDHGPARRPGLVRAPARARRPPGGRPARPLRASRASRRASRASAPSSSSGSPTTPSATGARPSATPTRTLFTRWYQEMLLRGVLFHPSQYENLFVSMVHTDDDIDRTLEAAAEALPVVAAERRDR